MKNKLTMEMKILYYKLKYIFINKIGSYKGNSIEIEIVTQPIKHELGETLNEKYAIQLNFLNILIQEKLIEEKDMFGIKSFLKKKYKIV